MVESKGWDWEKANKSFWLKPTEDCFYLANKWKELNFKSILDLGTGLGRHAIYFSKQGFNVSAMDISDYGIQHLKTWANNENLIIDAEVGDMLSLSYPDKSFDCIFAYHVISHSDTDGVKKTISEIERVLRPNGEIFLSFCSKETTDYTEDGLERIDENTVVRLNEPEKGVPHFFADLSNIMVLLYNFEIEKVRQIEYCDLNIDNKSRNKYFYVNAKLK